MFRIFSAVIVIGVFCNVTMAETPQGNVIRPKKVDANVRGCQVSEPDKYRASAGDLIELSYTFPITPLSVPKTVDRKWDRGAIYPSQLGIRNLIVPQIVGTGTYLFYFEARHEGSGTAIVVIDGVKYTYNFEVEANRRAFVTVGKGGVGESGALSLLVHKVQGKTQKSMVLRNVESNLCGNTGAFAVLLVNGIPQAHGAITDVKSTVQVTANPGDKVVAVVQTVPLFNGITCVRLGELHLELDEYDLVK